MPTLSASRPSRREPGVRLQQWTAKAIGLTIPRSVLQRADQVIEDKVPPTLAPEIGQHTVEVLRAAGMTSAEIERLLHAGVIVQA